MGDMGQFGTHHHRGEEMLLGGALELYEMQSGGLVFYTEKELIFRWWEVKTYVLIGQ